MTDETHQTGPRDMQSALRRIVELLDDNPCSALAHTIFNEIPLLRSIASPAAQPDRDLTQATGQTSILASGAALGAPDLYQTRVVFDEGHGDWMNVTADQVALLDTPRLRAAYQVRELFERSRAIAAQEWLPNCLFSVGVDGDGKVCFEGMWNTHTPESDYGVMLSALRSRATLDTSDVPEWRRPVEGEDPGAARMREEFDAQHGDMAGVLKAVYTYNGVTQAFHRGPLNEAQRVTLSTLEHARDEMLDRIRAEALWLARRHVAAS